MDWKIPVGEVTPSSSKLSHSDSPSTNIYSRLSAILRAVALSPLLALPVLFLIQFVAEQTQLPFGMLCLFTWIVSILLWLLSELLSTSHFRFGLARLLIVTALFCVTLGFGRAYVLMPVTHESETLAAIKGLSPSVHREPHGPDWMRWVLSDTYFERVCQLEIRGPEGGDAEIPKLESLPRLRCVFLTGPGFTDGGLDAITALSETATVYFTGTGVTPEGVERIREIRPNMQLELQ